MLVYLLYSCCPILSLSTELHCFLPGLLQQPPNWFPCLCLSSMQPILHSVARLPFQNTNLIMSLCSSLKLFILPISLKIKSTLLILSYKDIHNSFPVQPSVHSLHILHLSLIESISQTCHDISLLLPLHMLFPPSTLTCWMPTHPQRQGQLCPLLGIHSCPSQADILVPSLYSQNTYSGPIFSTSLAVYRLFIPLAWVLLTLLQ